jgi:hypothetical protein
MFFFEPAQLKLRVRRELGFSHISVRPKHPNPDNDAIAHFKKTLILAASLASVASSGFDLPDEPLISRPTNEPSCGSAATTGPPNSSISSAIA